MPATDFDSDSQDQAETYDETHLDDEGDGEFLLDEADPVLDVTQADGDSDEEAFDEDDLDIDGELSASGIEAEADALLGVESSPRNQIDGESNSQRGEDEVELVYSGLMENERGAQASAAHWEAKRLSDDDIDDLGYGPEGDRISQENAR